MINQEQAKRATIIGALVMFLTGGGGSIIVWAGDQRYQLKVETAALSDAVEQNTKALEATSSSVDKMLAQILENRIRELQEQIETLELKRTASALTTTERKALRDSKNELADAKQERAAILGRLLNRSQ